MSTVLTHPSPASTSLAQPTRLAATEPGMSELLAARPHLVMQPMGGLMLEGVPLQAIADRSARRSG